MKFAEDACARPAGRDQEASELRVEMDSAEAESDARFGQVVG